MTLGELMDSLQAHEQHLDERSQIEAKEALESQVSLRREKISLKTILNQVKKVKIYRIEDKKILAHAKKKEEVILQLKEIINLIFNIIIEKNMVITSKNVGLGDMMRGISRLMLQKIKMKIQRPCYQLIVLEGMKKKVYGFFIQAIVIICLVGKRCFLSQRRLLIQR